MKLPALVTTACFALFLGGELVQTLWHVAPEPELRGKAAPLPAFALSWKAWYNGTLQAQVESWLERRVGFRPIWVRTHNQINFSLFHELTKSAGTQIVLGQDNWLYEQPHIDSYLGADVSSPTFHQQFARDLKSLQDELARRHIAFLLVISPNKAALYPEYLPPAVASGEPPVSNYDRLLPLVRERGVHCVDAVERFRAEKAAHPFRLCPQGGTHWGYYGATLIVQDILGQLAELTGQPPVVLTAGPVTVDRETLVTENDLGELLNLWTPDAFKGPLPHVTLKRQGSPDGSSLNLLWLGSSFSWTPLDILTTHKCYDCCGFLFYYRTLYNFPPPSTFRRVTGLPFEAKTDLLARDAVVLEINASGLGPHRPDAYGPLFVKEALEFLRRREDAAP